MMTAEDPRIARLRRQLKINTSYPTSVTWRTLQEPDTAALFAAYDDREKQVDALTADVEMLRLQWAEENSRCQDALDKINAERSRAINIAASLWPDDTTGFDRFATAIEGDPETPEKPKAIA